MKRPSTGGPFGSIVRSFGRVFGVEADVMKSTAVSRRYAAALNRHLQGEAGGSADSAYDLGSATAAEGITAAELARIHASALIATTRSGRMLDRQGMKRAHEFFLAALQPMDRPAAAVAVQRARSLKQSARRLKESGAGVRASERKLERHTRMRQLSEKSLRQKRARMAQALKETNILEADLRSLARRTLAALECDRAEFSRMVQEEVAQSLIGIKLRLEQVVEKRSSEAAKLLSDISEARKLLKASEAKMRAVLARLGGAK